MEKTSEEVVDLFEILTENSQQFSSRGKKGLKGKGVYEVSTNGGVQTQMETMERKLNMIVKAMTNNSIAPFQ